MGRFECGVGVMTTGDLGIWGTPRRGKGGEWEEGMDCLLESLGSLVGGEVGRVGMARVGFEALARAFAFPGCAVQVLGGRVSWVGMEV